MRVYLSLLLLGLCQIGESKDPICIIKPAFVGDSDDKNFTGLAVLELGKYLDAVGFDVEMDSGCAHRVLFEYSTTFAHKDDHLINVTEALTTISGSTPLSLLYGVYTFSEKVLNIKFTIALDIIPDKLASPISLLSPSRVIRMSPGSFDIRGLQPFHDFNSGPDWWTLFDYRSVLSQMVKLKFNFIGFHSYPLKEPLVWVGDGNDVDSSGKVTAQSSYETYWRTTEDAGWGMVPRTTSSYTSGSSQLFSAQNRTCWGPPPQQNLPHCLPLTQEDYKAVFDDTLDLFTAVVSHAHSLGIKVAVGTEVPLSMPKGMTTEDAFTGIFKRLNHTNIDYYWHWTAEGGNTVNSTTTQQAVKDVATSISVWKSLQPLSFQLAASGWFIGPTDDPTYFDREYGSEISALSALDLGVGWDPMQPQYQDIKNHSTWVIPWMEDDPGLIGAELWVNRTIHHVKDAKKYGTRGVLGIHWRTVQPSLAMSALSQSLWEDTLTVQSFYDSFANSAFPEVASEASEIFVSLDSFKVGPEAVAPNPCWQSCTPNLPRPQLSCCASWGDIKTNVAEDYFFADAFSSLEDKVVNSHLEVYGVWAKQFAYQKSLAFLQMATWEFLDVMGNVTAIVDPGKRLEAALILGTGSMASMSRSYERMMTDLLSFTTSKGDMGMVAQQEGMNWMRNIMPIVFQLKLILAEDRPYTFLNCYVDGPTVRSMINGPGIIGHAFPHYGVQNCSLACSEFQYFAIQATTECFCSNNITRIMMYGPAATCDKTFGGVGINAVYQHEPKEVFHKSVWPTGSYLGGNRIYFMMPVTITPRHQLYTYPLYVQSGQPPSNVTLIVTAGGSSRQIPLVNDGGFDYSFQELVGFETFSYHAVCVFADADNVVTATIRVTTY